MRLLRMNIAGFRGFAEPVEFDLDADVVLVSGPNGSGKTSFLDAILWGLTGSVERIGSNDDLVNRFGDFGDARVEIVLRSRAGSELVVVRRFSGVETLTVTSDGVKKSGAAARSSLSSLLCRDGGVSDDSLESLSRSLTRSVYLQQDRVNAFIQTDDAKKRFEIVGELIGVGRLNELNRQLDSSRRAWTKKTNAQKREADDLSRQRDDLKLRLDGIDSSVEPERLSEECLAWLRTVNEETGRLEVEAPGAMSDVAGWASAVDTAVRRIIGEERVLEADASRCAEFRDALQELSSVVTADPKDSAAAVGDLERRVAEASRELEKAEEAASVAHRRRLARAEESKSLGGMAQFALKHLGDICPVCEQEYDRQRTEQRLHSLIEDSGLSPDVPENAELQRAADFLRQLEAQLVSEKAQLRKAESDSRRMGELEAQIESLANRHTGIPQPGTQSGKHTAQVEPSVDASASDATDPLFALDALKAAMHRRLAEFRRLRHDGEKLSVSAALAVEASEAETLRERLAELDARIASLEAKNVSRDKTSSDAERLHAAVRQLGESLVEAESRIIEPLLQRIYETVNPHPEFRAARLLTAMKRGRGHLWAEIETDTNGDVIRVEEPQTVLSSSQLNILAVAVFLALNLSNENPPVELVILDDPLQSLDGVNLLGLADLLRKLRGRRQMMISTHNELLASLFQRKLRSVKPEERTRVVSLTAWSREGPTVIQREAANEPAELVLHG